METWSEHRASMNKNRMQGVAMQGEQAKDSKGLLLM
jgi:hypothetical protein